MYNAYKIYYMSGEVKRKPPKLPPPLPSTSRNGNLRDQNHEGIYDDPNDFRISGIGNPGFVSSNEEGDYGDPDDFRVPSGPKLSTQTANIEKKRFPQKWILIGSILLFTVLLAIGVTVDILLRQTPLADPCLGSSCGEFTNCKSANNTAYCTCQDGYVGEPPNCHLECSIDSDCPNSMACLKQHCKSPCTDYCGPNAACSVNNHKPKCIDLKRFSCKTTNGPQTGVPCEFPFKLYGNDFQSCTYYGTNKPWCHTRVNPDNGEGYIVDWGFCDEECPIEPKSISGLSETCKTVAGLDPGSPCIFPFKHYGNVYDKCTLDGLNTPWCAKKVDNDGNFVVTSKGTCHKDCPADQIPDNLRYTKSNGSVTTLIPLPFAMPYPEVARQCGLLGARLPEFETEEDFNSFQKSIGLLTTYISKVIKTGYEILVWEDSGKPVGLTKFLSDEDQRKLSQDTCIWTFDNSWNLKACTEKWMGICEKIITY